MFGVGGINDATFDWCHLARGGVEWEVESSISNNSRGQPLPLFQAHRVRMHAHASRRECLLGIPAAAPALQNALQMALTGVGYTGRGLIARCGWRQCLCSRSTRYLLKGWRLGVPRAVEDCFLMGGAWKRSALDGRGLERQQAVATHAQQQAPAWCLPVCGYMRVRSLSN